jgi:hypothetical protein
MSNRCIRIQFTYGSSWQHPGVSPGCTSNTKRFPRSVDVSVSRCWREGQSRGHIHQAGQRVGPHLLHHLAVAVPLILNDSDVTTEQIEINDVHGESWRCLKVEFPPRLVTHSAEQTFYFDREALLRRVDYPAIDDDQTQIAQVFWEHQRFSGILVPTLCRILKIGVNGLLSAEPPLVDIEIFDAAFEYNAIGECTLPATARPASGGLSIRVTAC